MDARYKQQIVSACDEVKHININDFREIEKSELEIISNVRMRHV